MSKQAIAMIEQAHWTQPFETRRRLRREEPMARHSSWRCGGSAALYFEPEDREDLVAFLASAPQDEAIHWLGLGSNVLIRDGGIDGIVVSTAQGLNAFEWLDEQRLHADCGVACARLARVGAARNRAGLEFMAGIPGTLGGALAMNAGALGSETWDFVESVETVARDGRVRTRPRADFEAGYRSVKGGEGEWFLSAVLNLPDSAEGGGAARIRDVLAQRGATQPTGKASCGSVFTNPPGDFAGRLIEHCGLKGHRVGGCVVSDVHANFIVNDRNASAADVENLIAHVRETVEAQTGVRLTPEVRIIGRSAGEFA